MRSVTTVPVRQIDIFFDSILVEVAHREGIGRQGISFKVAKQLSKFWHEFWAARDFIASPFREPDAKISAGRSRLIALMKFFCDSGPERASDFKDPREFLNGMQVGAVGQVDRRLGQRNDHAPSIPRIRQPAPGLLFLRFQWMVVGPLRSIG